MRTTFVLAYRACRNETWLADKSNVGLANVFEDFHPCTMIPTDIILIPADAALLPTDTSLISTDTALISTNIPLIPRDSFDSLYWINIGPIEPVHFITSAPTVKIAHPEPVEPHTLVIIMWHAHQNFLKGKSRRL